jgi:hypothetical protein
MTTISPLSGSVVSAPPVFKVQGQQNLPIVADTGAQASSVASSGSLHSMQAPLASALTWKVKSSDPLTSLMTINYGSKSLLDRFDGLGAAALRDPGDFSQSVSLLNADPVAGGYQVTLSIKMADGIDVKVNLDSKANSLALQVSSSSKLGATDRAALAKLADGFQNAIDSMRDGSKLDFTGLLAYDPASVSSIDVQAKTQFGTTPAQMQTFHVDHAKRSFTSDGPDGKVSVSVDLRQLAGMGNAQQRKAGMDAYLKQFDEAGIRGHANESTMATFKSAFQQMTGVASETTVVSNRPINLSDSDHALLTGLPDFDASMSDTPVASNPMRQNEVDTFSYQVSQDTSISGDSQRNRSISQKQHTHLEASFHESLGATPLALDNSKGSQNYYFKHVSEDRSRDTEIGYHNGMLVRGTVDEHITRTTQVLKYVMGILTDESSTPEVSNTRRDLLTQISPR